MMVLASEGHTPIPVANGLRLLQQLTCFKALASWENNPSPAAIAWHLIQHKLLLLVVLDPNVQVLCKILHMFPGFSGVGKGVFWKGVFPERLIV